jgi:mannose-6-phosphate isomerase-like protein (cupin superfamily)
MSDSTKGQRHSGIVKRITTSQSVKVNLSDIPTEIIHDGTVQRKALVRPDELGEVATMNYAWLEPGQAFKEHTHPDCYEFFLILEGKGLMRVGETSYEVGPDDFITVNPTQPHSLKAGKGALKFLTMRAFEKLK